MAKAKADTEETTDTMQSLADELGDNLVPIHLNEVAEVTIQSVGKGAIWADVAGVAVGIIPEREFSYGSQDLKAGDKVVAYVLSLEDKEGRVVLSLRRADRERLWVTLKDKFENGEVIQAKVVEVNKGGLMVEVGGVVGFLPISQLASQHYPRVGQGSRDDITAKLAELVNQTINVKIINFDKTTNKLIFSEKAAGDVATEEKLNKIVIGEELKGKITGIVDFGLFVDIGEGIEGLVHISEVSWRRVNDLRTIYSVGDEIAVQVTGIADGKVSLSVKRLTSDPWVEAASTFTIGETVSGIVTRITPFGAFVKLNDVVDGLVHISELSDERIEDPNTVIAVGDNKSFKILTIDNQAHRISLSLKALKAKDKKAEKVEQEPEVAEKAEKVEKTEKAEKVKTKAKEKTDK